MAGSTKAVRIGVIAEEKNDVDVLYELTCKIIKENHFAFSNFVGHGCGKLRRKCKAWARTLLDRGCSHIVVIHDLDTHNEKCLRAMLEGEIAELRGAVKVVLIPNEELEAWLLSDSDALKIAFNMRKLPKIPRWPERIDSPKEFLAEVVRQNSRAQYLNTVHNRQIAKALAISKLARCPSFSPYPRFLDVVFPKAASRVG